MSHSALLPTIILTGASGLLGKYLLDELKNDFRIFAIARRSQNECSAPKHPNIAWMRADISDLSSITKTFREIKTAGGADYFIHLAAYYDFENEYHPEYERTNIYGTANVLKLAEDLNLKLFLFASSVAACSFPPSDGFVDENSPADGLHIYAKSKKAGEDLVLKFAKHTKSCIMRLGAIYTDWCEYAPLYMQINTWVSNSLKAKILGGRGESAIPYIHIRDVIRFIKEILINHTKINSGEILIASTNGSTSHLQLYKLTTRYFFGREKNPILLPKFICAIGLHLLNLISKVVKIKSFEKPWMIRYIDKKLNVKLRKTIEKVNWQPDPRLNIEKRIPFIIERMKSEPITWQIRNTLLLRKTEARIDFAIYSALVDFEEKIVEQILNLIKNSSDEKIKAVIAKADSQDLKWFVKLIYRLLLTSINTNNKLLIQNYFEVSSINRFESGYDCDSIIFILKKIEEGIIEHLSDDERANKFKKEFYNFITLPVEFGIDEIEQQYNLFVNKIKTVIKEVEQNTPQNKVSAREQLEETIWSCLVNRK